jgi:hypothetical protein
MELFSVLVAAYLGLECLANFNQVYAYVNKREPWKITKWSSNLFYKWHPKLGVFVLGAVWYVAMACAAVLAEQDWFIGFLDFWLYTRIPAW